MLTSHKVQRTDWRTDWVVYLLIALVLIATLLVLLSLMQRNAVRDQILARDAAILHSVAGLEYARLLDEPLIGDEYLDLALSASQLDGVLGFKIIGDDGRVLASIPEGEWPQQDSEWMQRQFASGKSWTYFLSEGHTLAHEINSPMLLVGVTVAESHGEAGKINLIYWLDGHSVAAQFRELDRSLFWQGFILFLAVSLVAIVLFLFAIQRQKATLADLQRRTAELERANAELLFVTKTSALGAISADLLHALKNPLMGLQNYMARESVDPDVKETAAKMQKLLQDALSMLRPEDVSLHTAYSLEEIVELVLCKPVLRDNVERIQVDLPTLADGLQFDSKTTHLCVLILANLLVNAFEATPDRQTVLLSFAVEKGERIFRVHDRGSGLAEDRQSSPFRAVPSSKVGGTGLGLPLSHQLAMHLGARLELQSSSHEGTIFRLCLPESLFCNLNRFEVKV
jgi:signal transduction histidine kinase